MAKVVNLFGPGSDYGNGRPGSTILRLLGVLILTILLFAAGCACVTRVGPGYVGIKVSMAGTNRGVEDAPATTGWVFYNPLITKVYAYPTFVQTAKWTRDPHEGRPINEEITFTNKDSMLIAADISLSYSLKADKVPHFYVKFRNDNLDDFTHGFLRNVARDQFNETAGKFSIEQIMGDNGPFLGEVRDKLQKQVDAVGVVIEQFGFIGAPRPPDAIIAAINLKVQAQQVALQKTIEITQAEADKKKTIVQAEAASEQIRIRAEAEARANQLLSSSINQNLIEWRRLEIQSKAVERWNGVRPQVEGTGSGLLIQLPKP
jgi:regulator of protease activity HflC (stomatin/prohibitin superfamily)